MKGIFVSVELLKTLLAGHLAIGHKAAKQELRAILSAPSPAGVDGCKCSMSISMLGDGCRHCQPQEYIDILGEILNEERAELSDAQATIDGLRGENERIRLNIAEYNESIACYQSERDQQDQRIGELEWLLLDTGAERNAMQRERDAYKLLLDRECNDSDSIFMALGVAPDSIRTEGGFLMVAHLVSLISAKSEKLETLLHEAIPGLQHLSDTAQDIDTFTLVARVKSALSAGKEGE